MTLLEIVNKVLRRLREDSVGSITEGYPRLILEFVADAHRELQEFHDWKYYDTTVTVRLTAGQNEFDLTKLVADGGAVESGSTIPADNCFIRTNEDGVAAWLYDDTGTDVSGTNVTLSDWDDLENQYRQLTNATGEPSDIALQRSPNGSGFRLKVYPTPTATRTLRMRWHAPEALIDPDSDVDTRTLVCPWRALVLGGTFYALNERGEEMGEPGAIAERKFYAELTSEKERDIAVGQLTGQFEFYRD